MKKNGWSEINGIKKNALKSVGKQNKILELLESISGLAKKIISEQKASFVMGILILGYWI
jgi:hypothetical protein